MPITDNTHNSPKKDRYSLRSKKRDTKIRIKGNNHLIVNLQLQKKIIMMMRKMRKSKSLINCNIASSYQSYSRLDSSTVELRNCKKRKILMKMMKMKTKTICQARRGHQKNLQQDSKHLRASDEKTKLLVRPKAKKRKNMMKKMKEINDEQNINIIFTLGQPTVHYGKYDDYEEELDSEDYDEDEDDYENELEHLEGDETESSSEEEEVKHKSRRKQKGKSTSKKLPEELEGLNERLGELVSALEKEASCKNEIINESKPQTDKDIIKKFISMAKECKGVNKKSRVVKELIEIGEEKLKDIEKEETAKEKGKTQKSERFRKGVTEKNVMNDYAFFTKMSLEKAKTSC